MFKTSRTVRVSSHTRLDCMDTRLALVLHKLYLSYTYFFFGLVSTVFGVVYSRTPVKVFSFKAATRKGDCVKMFPSQFCCFHNVCVCRTFMFKLDFSYFTCYHSFFCLMFKMRGPASTKAVGVITSCVRKRLFVWDNW